MTPTRDALQQSFLNAHGWGDAHFSPIPGDASFRTYARLTRGKDKALLMDAPPPQEDISPYAAIAQYLIAQGFHAPRIYAHDVQSGFLLIEDFGDAKFSSVLEKSPRLEHALYKAGMDVLLKLEALPSPATLVALEGHHHIIGLYDHQALLREAQLLLDWYYPTVTGKGAAPQLQAQFTDAWAPLFDFLETRLENSRTLVLRDFHVDNLMWIGTDETAINVGLLDFQDALTGDPAYDLVSLLQDARRDISPTLEQFYLEYYLNTSGVADKDAFLKAYAILGAQRSVKIIGIFARLWKRDGKPKYLDHLPRLWRYVQHNFSHPALTPVKDWFDLYIPGKLRASDPRSKAA